MKSKIENLVKNQMKFCLKANPVVLRFIFEFLYHNCKNDEEVEATRLKFMSGYCYYFAIMLKVAFERGSICWAAPFGHIVWLDIDGIPYDIEGVSTSEAEYYIPISYIKEGLKDFKHIHGEEFNASEDYINKAILQYKKDNNLI